MSEDTGQDKLRAELGEFFGNYAAAWSAFDTDAVALFLAVPFMQVSGTMTAFFETGAEIDAMLAAEAERWRVQGVTGATVRLVQVLALPDDAARVDVEWMMSGENGTELARFKVRYTLAAEAGRWAVMVADSGTATRAAADLP